MKKKQASLRDSIISGSSVRRKPSNWIERLPEAARAEIEDIKRDWRAGVFQSSCLSLAKSIVVQCDERGIKTCGVNGVRAWLAGH